MSPFVKSVLRQAFGAGTCVALPFSARDGAVRVFYGGARSGDLGGPLVKVRHLQSRFPEWRVGFSLLYQLSNAIYLPSFAFRAVKQRGIPLVLNQNGVFYRAWYPDGWERENARMAEVHGAATHVLYQSAFCRRAAERFLGPAGGTTEILYNAVPTDRFTPRAEVRPAWPVTALLTGKITPATAYRLTAALEGLAAARRGGLDIVLRVAGYVEPGVVVSARALADRLGIAAAVTWLGPYTHAQAPDIYRSADIYLMTKHNDPCPNVVLEAMASGLPVVYSDSGGVPELVGAEAGVALAVAESFEENVAPSPQAVAEGLARAMREREAMGAAARQRAVARFDLADWLERHGQLFARLVAEARA